jgi:hypothetical protein
MIKLRDDLFSATRSAVDIWSTDAGVSDVRVFFVCLFGEDLQANGFAKALSDVFKSITCLPSDITLISLPAGPLLELVCLAIKRHLTAAWLSLASILIAQLDPPSLILNTLKSEPHPESHAIIANVFPQLLEPCWVFFNQPGAMEEAR